MNRFADMDIDDELQSRKVHEKALCEFLRDAELLPDERRKALFLRRFPNAPADLWNKILLVLGVIDANATESTATQPELKRQPPPVPGELERLRAFAQLTLEDAIRSMVSMIPNMDEKTIIAGWLHVKGTTWSDMECKTKASKGTLSKRVRDFYRASGLPRNNRRKGIGKEYQLDEHRDAGSL